MRADGVVGPLAEGYVTTVVRREIVQGHEREFDDWLKRFLAEERKAPGFVGVTVIAPAGSSNLRYIVHQWSNIDTLVAWESSATRASMLAEANRYSVPHFERASGMENWFTLPENALPNAPPRWKMFLVLLFAATAISAAVRYTLAALAVPWPIWLDALVSALILVASLTYVVMPALTRLLRSWLYPRETEVLSLGAA